MNIEFKEEIVITDKIFTLPADADGRQKMEEWIDEKHGIKDTSVIARSILSREIKAFFIGSGKRYITLFATHHALESITANLAYMLIDTLLEAEEKGRIYGIDCKLLLSKYRFVIVPCVNLDGVELRYHGAGRTPLYERLMRMSGADFSTWQANARGVDLNHNYDFGFVEYKLIEKERGIVAGASLYSGEYPESEPETKGVATLIRTFDPVAVVSLHSQGEEIFSFPSTPRVKRIARRISEMTGYALSTPTGTASYTGLCDYTASLGIPSFTLEVGRGTNPLPEMSAPDIFPRIAEALITLPTLL